MYFIVSMCFYKKIVTLPGICIYNIFDRLSGVSYMKVIIKCGRDRRMFKDGSSSVQSRVCQQ